MMFWAASTLVQVAAQASAGASGIQESKMRIFATVAAVCALVSGASARGFDNPTAFIVSPIHDAQVVRGDDGMDHVEYDLLVVSVLPEPVSLTSITVLGPAGKELKRIAGAGRPRGCDPAALCTYGHNRDCGIGSGSG
jgi:hypothetical protein